MEVFKRALALAVCFFAATNAHAGQRLKILHLNFNSELVPFDDRSDFIRDIRFAAIKKWIEEESPDLIVLDENWSYRKWISLTIPLAEQTGYDQAYAVGLGAPGFLWDSNSLMAKKKFHMTEVRDTVLAHSAFHIGDGIHGRTSFGSLSHVIGAKLTLDNGEPLFVYGSHLLGGSESDRNDQILGVLGAIKKQLADNGVAEDRAHVIFAGDLNSGPKEATNLTLAEAGFIDTWGAAHPDHVMDEASATSCNNPYGPFFNPVTLGAHQVPDQTVPGGDDRIDWIYARGPGTQVLASTKMFTRRYSGFWMSDHYGVVSTIAIGGDSGDPVPNDLSDSDGHTPPPARVIEVTDKMVMACSKHKICDISSGSLMVGSRGVTIWNKSSHVLKTSLWGMGRALPSKEALLKPGHAASFVLYGDGIYTAGVKTQGRKLRADLLYVENP